MSMFIRVPQKNNDVIGVNSERVEQFGFRPGQDTPTVHLFLIGKGKNKHHEVEFKTDADAVNFIESNFTLFNA